jgi:hypothetical protein
MRRVIFMISWKIFGGLRSQVDTGFFRPRPQARPRCRFRIVTRAQNRLRFHVLSLKRKQDPLRIFAVVLDTCRLTRVSPSLNRMKFVSLSRWSLAGTPTACVPRSRKTFCTCYISLKLRPLVRRRRLLQPSRDSPLLPAAGRAGSRRR